MDAHVSSPWDAQRMRSWCVFEELLELARWHCRDGVHHQHGASWGWRVRRHFVLSPCGTYHLNGQDSLNWVVEHWTWNKCGFIGTLTITYVGSYPQWLYICHLRPYPKYSLTPATFFSRLIFGPMLGLFNWREWIIIRISLLNWS